MAKPKPPCDGLTGDAFERRNADLMQITPETLELLKIQHRVEEARTQAARRRLGPGPVGLVPKAHFQLRAIMGKFSGQIWWAIVASPDQLKSATRHPDSGTAIRGASRLELYKLTQRRCIPLDVPGIKRPTDAELATMPSPIPHLPDCTRENARIDGRDRWYMVECTCAKTITHDA